MGGAKPCPETGYCPVPLEWWEVALRTLWVQILLGVIAICICAACMGTCVYARQIPDESADWVKQHLKENAYSPQKAANASRNAGNGYTSVGIPSPKQFLSQNGSSQQVQVQQPYGPQAGNGSSSRVLMGGTP